MTYLGIYVPYVIIYTYNMYYLHLKWISTPKEE